MRCVWACVGARAHSTLSYREIAKRNKLNKQSVSFPFINKYVWTHSGNCMHTKTNIQHTAQAPAHKLWIGMNVKRFKIENREKMNKYIHIKKTEILKIHSNRANEEERVRVRRKINPTIEIKLNMHGQRTNHTIFALALESM